MNPIVTVNTENYLTRSFNGFRQSLHMSPIVDNLDLFCLNEKGHLNVRSESTFLWYLKTFTNMTRIS